MQNLVKVVVSVDGKPAQRMLRNKEGHMLRGNPGAMVQLHVHNLTKTTIEVVAHTNGAAPIATRELLGTVIGPAGSCLLVHDSSGGAIRIPELEVRGSDDRSALGKVQLDVHSLIPSHMRPGNGHGKPAHSPGRLVRLKSTPCQQFLFQLLDSVAIAQRGLDFYDFLENEMNEAADDEPTYAPGLQFGGPRAMTERIAD
jgi:hypothetical protein